MPVEGGVCGAGVGAYPEIDRSEKTKTTGQFGNLTGNGLIFEKVTGQRVAAVAASVAAVAASNVGLYSQTNCMSARACTQNTRRGRV